MPEPDPTLQSTALRYAAGDLAPDEVTAFESRLADDQDARDALAEAVRLSAAAIGQPAPAPHPSFRTATRVRLGLLGYRGHPFGWIGLGAAVVAACALFAVSLADRADAPEAATAAPVPAPAEASSPAADAEPVAPAAAPPRDATTVAVENQPAGCGGDEHRSVAEIWADLSSPDHVEKARDNELRLRQRVRDLANPNHVSATARAGVADHP
ncbi:MAG: hypothetical protein J0I06_06110 [Planctomycetes bacterium]|nr:hypothetical protein [Planctomycetota bacterium]